MQGFRTYKYPCGMLLLHSGSNGFTECEKEVEPIIDNKAS